MEAYLLDVGQGTSNVVVLGAQEAIVIDAGGATDRTLFRLLQRLSIVRLRHLILSHNHEDHLGGAVSLLDHFEGAINDLWFVNDTKLMGSRFWERLLEQRSAGIFGEDHWHRLERTNTPVAIHTDASGVSLEVFAPTFAANLMAQIANSPNATSGVLALRCGPHSILFGGDATLDEWKSIEQLLNQPVRCDVLAVSHHGGDMGFKSLADLQWLYSKAVIPKVAVVSVGTSNSHDHPREDVLRQLRSANAKIMCTQLTEKCCGNLEGVRPGVMPPGMISRSSAKRDVTSRNRSRNVACSGTVVIELDGSGVRVESRDVHDHRIDMLTSQGHLRPLCRP